MKTLDYLMWSMFIATFIISIFTMLVVFGIVWTGWMSYFATLLPLELSLAATFFVWGTNSVYNIYTKNSKYTLYYSLVLGSTLLVFAAFGIY
jgi:hypothetical protein